jgi:peptide/nickel transport system substrate-binding protein
MRGGTGRRRILAMGLAAFLVAGLSTMARAETVLRIVPQADLKILDTVWTTNNVTSNHGYLIYDVLFAPNAKLEFKPQMVDTYSKSADGLVLRFKLRDGLKFSDGSPVEAKDAVASIKRYGDRIPVGKTLMQFTKEVVATGPQTFEIRLAKPFGPVLDVLGTPENPLFVHREKEALTPSDQQITEAIGSGPFVMVKEEWVPGSKVVYKKNPLYKPRADAPDGFAGAKLAKVDRIEWIVIPDANTATQALIKGEVDVIEIPTTDHLPLMKRAGNITIQVIDRVGTQPILRPNHLIPPFNNAKNRQALLYAVGDQKDYLAAIVGNPE